MKRRVFLGGALVSVLGGAYVLASTSEAQRRRAEKRPDGRPRLPPGQHLLSRLRPMGGEEGDVRASAFRLRVHGDVEAPFVLDFRDLLQLPVVDLLLDVHCVTKWTVLDAPFSGVRVSTLAERARPKASARFVIFEAAHGYTANVPLREALSPNALVAHRHEGAPLGRAHGAPVRALVPDLYFWKSAKYLTGIRFSEVDVPGYWETRGYHNHGDPWREERYA